MCFDILNFRFSFVASSLQHFPQNHLSLGLGLLFTGYIAINLGRGETDYTSIKIHLLSLIPQALTLVRKR